MTFTEKYGDATVIHEEKYKKAVTDIGFDKIRSILPWSDEQLVDAYKADKHFNSIKISEWDRIAGYHEDRKTGALTSYNSPLKDWIYKAGIDYFSCSELVCILKEAAREAVERKENV